MTATEVLIRLVSDSVQPGACKGCGRKILWFDTPVGKRMPMDAHAMIRQLGIGFDMYAASDSHWTSCPKRDKFDKRKHE
jgi:hypothetical protein